MTDVSIGVDLGGTKISAVALSQDGRELLRSRVDTPQGDYPATLNAVVQLVEILRYSPALNGLPVHKAIGIGTPGSVSTTTAAMKNCNSTCLNHHFLQRDLEALLNSPVILSNDANCFALSESIDGAAAGASVVFGIILGTGTGGGLVINQQLLAGADNIAGEWGHNPLHWPGDENRPCYCGRKNCVETFLSGEGLINTWKKLGGQGLVTAKTLAASDDELADRVLQRYSEQLAKALAAVINIIDPEIIVVGGGLSNIDRLYQWLPQQLPQWLFNDRLQTRVVPARHGDDSGVRGAARLVNGSLA